MNQRVETNYVRFLPDGRYDDLADDQFVYAKLGAGKKGLILPAGGLAPGMNLVIKNLVQANGTEEVEFYGVNGGVGATNNTDNICRLVAGQEIDPILQKNSINTKYRSTEQGGTNAKLILEMGRGENPEGDTEDVANFVLQNRINVLIMIGGDGTLQATRAIAQKIRQKKPDNQVQIVHLPKTIDGDTPYGRTFGLKSATEDIRQKIKAVDPEHGSNSGELVVNILEAMGRGSGKLALEVTTGCRQVDLVIIPEIAISIEQVKKKVLEATKDHKGVNILVAEGVTGIAGLDIAKDEKPIHALKRYLAEFFDERSIKINTQERDYQQRNAPVSAEDETIINALCHTALGALSSGAKEITVVGTSEVLDLEKIPEKEAFTLSKEQILKLKSQGYTDQQLRPFIDKN